MDEESLAVPQNVREVYGPIFERGKHLVGVLRDCLADKDYTAAGEAWDDCLDWLESAHESPQLTLQICENALTRIADILEG